MGYNSGLLLKKYINWVIYLGEDVGYPHLQPNLECLEKPGKKAPMTTMNICFSLFGCTVPAKNICSCLFGNLFYFLLIDNDDI